MKNRMNFFKISLVVLSLCLSACNDYLDIIPDNIATIEMSFNSRLNAEKYLFTCYSRLDNISYEKNNVAIMSSREQWLTLEDLSNTEYDGAIYGWRPARGLQNANTPYIDYWSGVNGGVNYFIAIRDCNIFLEEIDKVRDMTETEKNRWKAEVKFLKAYYHFYLLRMYGPIPIIDKNLPIGATPDEVRIYRDPVDDVAQYIVGLLDEAAKDLPSSITYLVEELGRATRPIALALKAQTLALVASPLFNGNPYYVNIKDRRGTHLFSQTEDRNKWTIAAQAAKEAIEAAEAAGHGLFYYTNNALLNDSTVAKLNYRCAITERWNKEIVWGCSRVNAYYQFDAHPRTAQSQYVSGPRAFLSVTLDAAERYYSKNGVPISEDKTLMDYFAGENRYQKAVVDSFHCYYMLENFETVNLNLNREVRFYASLNFDGGMMYGNGKFTDNPATNTYLRMKAGESSGRIDVAKYSVTGYMPKKIIHLQTLLNDLGGFTTYYYSFPYIRLADLYLLYAETLNESKAAPDAEVYEYIDKVRERVSLKGVVESWTNYSSSPEKVTTRAGMREIIHRERLIELAYEGPPYWDILRWKEAETLWNRPIRGWNIYGTNWDDYYTVKVIAPSTFGIKDYLAPIKQSNLDQNANLIQNPGW
jgi:hypothetical protein